MALEPYFRRLWPQQLVSWIRLFDPSFKDPKVGRDVLLGGVAGISIALFHHLYFLLPRWLGTAPLLIWGTNPPTYQDKLLPTALGGTRLAVGQMLGLAGQAISFGLIWVMVLTLLAIVLRRRWLAVLTWGALFILVGLLTAGPWSGRIAVTLAFVLAMFTLLRFGVLSLVTAVFVSSLVSAVPMTIDLTKWFSGSTMIAFAVLIGLATYGAWIASAGHPLIRD